AFVWKLSANGTTAWAQDAGGYRQDAIATGVAVDAAGDVYVGGSFSNPYDYKVYYTKYVTYYDYASYSCVTISYPAYYYYAPPVVVGITRRTATGAQDAFAWKLDGANGTTAWTSQAGGVGATVDGSGIAVDSSGDVFVVGDFNHVPGCSVSFGGNSVTATG